jgi:hypothetical protein
MLHRTDGDEPNGVAGSQYGRRGDEGFGRQLDAGIVGGERFWGGRIAVLQGGLGDVGD